MMTRNEAFFKYINYAETWDRIFKIGYSLLMKPMKERDIITEQIRNFFRVEIERSISFTVADERVLMDMEGFITLLPGVPGENKVVRFEFEFGEKKETMAKIKTYAGVAVCPQCHNSINIQGATTTLGKISCKCGYEVQFDLGGKNGS